MSVNPRSPISRSIGIAGSKLEGKSSVLKKTIKYMYITKGCPIFSVNLLANPFYKIYPSRPTKGKKKNNWEEKVAHAKEENSEISKPHLRFKPFDSVGLGEVSLEATLMVQGLKLHLR